jgi:hypothetical protein
MINRRSFLYGAGSSIFLPYFSSISLGSSPKVDPDIKRIIFVFSPNGMNMDSWRIDNSQKDLSTLSPTLEVLEKFKDKTIVYSGMAQKKARANGDGGGDHARSMSTFLTGVQIKKTEGENITAGISADQLAANYFKSFTRIPSLQVGCEESKVVGSCDSGYSCAYSSTVSWAGPHSPLPKDINPASIFTRIYGNSSKSNPQTLEKTKSIIDYALEEHKSLQRNLSFSDKQKLDEYLNSLREIERKIQLEHLLPKEDDNQRESFSYMPDNLTQHSKLISDLIVLSFLTDSTRVATIVLSNEGSNKMYPEIDVTEGHHYLSHHQNDAEKLNKISKINKLHLSQINYLLNILEQNDLLDSTLVAYGCGIEDGNSHAHHDLPILIAGCGIKGNQHISMPEETPLNNLWLGLLDHIGVKIDDIEFGDSNSIIKLL